MEIRTLIVDDNPVFCMELENALRRDGDFAVTAVAHNGLEALEYLGRYPTDLMVLDGIMPQMDGMGVLEEIRRLALPMPRVAIVSAMEGDELIRSYLLKGAQAFFIKPISVDMLVKRLHGLCDAGEDAPVIPMRVRQMTDPRITALLHKIAVPPHVKGYRYLIDAISMVAGDAALIKQITTVLYPAVARRYGSSPARVERAMRHAIELAWDRCRVEDMEELFGYTVAEDKDKPSNSEFIAMLADRVRLQGTRNEEDYQ